MLRRDTHIGPIDTPIPAPTRLTTVAHCGASCTICGRKPSRLHLLPHRRVLSPRQSQAAFDTLDFDVFSGQEWDRLKQSHSKDVTVYWPDGHATHGIDKHIADMKALFLYAPR